MLRRSRAPLRGLDAWWRWSSRPTTCGARPS